MMAEEEYEDLEAEIQALKATFEAELEDVRERVIQVKRETDSKAEADHDHPSRDEEITDLRSDLAEQRATVEDLEAQLEGGFDNFEEILETVFDRTEEIESDVDSIGRAVKSMRETLDTIAEREKRRARADHLKQTAAARGVRKAKCEACNAPVDIALLSEASCPSCGETFNNLDANPGFFGTSILETGQLPALEGETADLGGNRDREIPRGHSHGDRKRESIDSRRSSGDRNGKTGDESETPFNWQTDDQGINR